jgi:hypothetical protein
MIRKNLLLTDKSDSVAKILNHSARYWETQEVPFNTHLERDYPAARACQVAFEEHPDLIGIGSQGVNRATNLYLTDVTALSAIALIFRLWWSI